MTKLKNCLKEPIQEIFEAAKLLDAAVEAHINGDIIQTEKLILKADIPEIRDWTESIWVCSAIKNHPKVVEH